MRRDTTPLGPETHTSTHARTAFLLAAAPTDTTPSTTPGVRTGCIPAITQMPAHPPPAAVEAPRLADGVGQPLDGKSFSMSSSAAGVLQVVQ